jgi:hypothetical protein
MGQGLSVYLLSLNLVQLIHLWLGMGMFCKELCTNNKALCTYELHRQLCDLNPYDHLR